MIQTVPDPANLKVSVNVTVTGAVTEQLGPGLRAEGWKRMKREPINVTLLGVAMLVGGCGVLGPEACTSDLSWRVTPEEAQLAVGESSIARAEAFGCGGREPLDEDMRWTSADPAVASVDPMTGRITAEAPGNTTIIGEDVGPYRIGPVEIPVTVLP